MEETFEYESGQEGRVGINLRIDKDKFEVMEKKRRVGFGRVKTVRNRSDACNELLGWGIEVDDLRQRMGEDRFVALWKILHGDLSHLNLEKIAEMMDRKKR